MTTTQMPPKPLTVEGLAEYFEISPDTVYTHVASGRFEHTRIGPREIRFTAENVAAILASGFRPAAAASSAADGVVVPMTQRASALPPRPKTQRTRRYA